MRHLRRLINSWYAYGEEHPGTIALVSLGIGAVAMALVVFSLYSDQITRDVVDRQSTTIVRRSPCSGNPEGKRCQRILREAAEARTVHDACIAFEKVALDDRLLRLTKCETEGGGASGGNNNPSSLPGPEESGPADQPEAPAEPPPAESAKHPVEEVLNEVGNVAEEAVCELSVILCP